MRSIRVVVNTAEERCRRVLTDVLHEEMTASRVFINERRDIVNKARDQD